MMRRRNLGLPWGGAALILLGCLALASDALCADFQQLEQTLRKDFPEAAAPAARTSLANFVADPAVFSLVRSPTLVTVRRTGKVVRVERNRILVQLQPTATADEIRRVLEENRLKIVPGGAPVIGLLLVEIPGPPPNPAQAALAEDSKVLIDNVDRVIFALREEKYAKVVREAAPNVLLGTTVLPPPSKSTGKDDRDKVYLYDWGNTSRDGNWGQKMVRFPGAWNFGDALRRLQGPPVGVGVLDVGFNQHENLTFTHSKITEQRVRNHGNHVLGIIGARWDTPAGVRGCTPFAHLTACTVPDVSTAQGDMPTIFLAFSDIVATTLTFIRSTEGLKVINISLGYNWVLNEKENSNKSIRIHDYVRAHGRMVGSVADLAAEKGIIIVSAAGNDSSPGGEFAEIDAQYASPFNWAAVNKGISGPPARNIVVVEAIGRSGKRASFSNVRGHLAAPGEEVLSTVARSNAFDSLEHLSVPPASKPVSNNYAVYEGTSMATPHVTGLIALMHAYLYDPKEKELAPAARDQAAREKMKKILEILLKTANAERNPGYAPVIDAFKAMLACRDTALRDLANLDTADEKGGGPPRVNMADFLAFKKAYGDAKAGRGDSFPRADLNGDGKVDLEDLEIMKKVWDDKAVKKDDLDKMLDQ